MVVVDDSSLQADSQPKSGGLVWGSTAACALFCNSSNEPSELSQMACGHDDSTINIVMVIIIIIIANGWKWSEGNGARKAEIVMLWTEYELCTSGANSPRLTCILSLSVLAAIFQVNLG